MLLIDLGPNILWLWSMFCYKHLARILVLGMTLVASSQQLSNKARLVTLQANPGIAHLSAPFMVMHTIGGVNFLILQHIQKALASRI
jgi:hypothetical protein